MALHSLIVNGPVVSPVTLEKEDIGWGGKGVLDGKDTDLWKWLPSYCRSLRESCAQKEPKHRKGDLEEPLKFLCAPHQPLIREGIGDYESPCFQLVNDFFRVSMVAKERHDPKAT